MWPPIIFGIAVAIHSLLPQFFIASLFFPTMQPPLSLKRDSSGFEGSIVYKLEIGGRERGKIAFMQGRKFIYHFKGPFILSQLVGEDSLSMLLGKILIRHDSGYVYHIKPIQAQIQFYQLPKEKPPNTLKMQATGQKAYIAGQECTLWIGNFHAPKTMGRALLQVWTSRKISLLPQNGQVQNDLFWIAPTNYGFPLKKKIIYLDSGVEVTLTAEKIISAFLPSTLFELPSHYKLIPFDRWQSAQW